MRPLRLHVEGFTSFRQPQEIDFTDLDLFVITGPTGSGKTSILDAVTLALYGQVPRANKMELKELISLGASQAKVQLDFKVGRTAFRVARRLPRKGAQSATIERVDGGAAFPEVEGSGVKEANERIVEIVGLDYDAFTRAVLLPQGAFSEFLKGDAAQRRRILIRLLDLERFEVAKRKAGEKAKELDHAVASTADLVLREYGDVTEEAVEAACTEARTASEGATRLEGVLKLAKQHAREWENIARRRESLRKMGASLEAQVEELESLAESSRGLEQRDIETEVALKNAQTSRDDAEKDRQKLRGEWKRTVDETGDEAALASLESAAATLDECRRRIRELDGAIEADSNEFQALTDRRAEAENLVTEAEAAEKDAKEARDGAKADLDSARGQLREATQLAAQRHDLEGKQEAVESLRRDLGEAENAAKEARGALETAKAALQRIETEERAAALRSHLDVGDECPVCGSEVAEIPAWAQATDVEITAARAAREKAEGTASEVDRRVAGLKATVISEQRAIEDLVERVDAMGGVPAVPVAEESVVRSEKAEQRARAELDAAAETAKRLSKQRNEIDVRLAKLEAKLASDRKALAAERDRAAGAEARLREGLGKPLPDQPREVIGSRWESLRSATAARDAAERHFDAAAEAHDIASAERRALEGEMVNLKGSLGNHRVLLDERRERLLEIEAVKAPPVQIAEEVSVEIPALRRYSRALCGEASQAEMRCGERLGEVNEALARLASEAAIDFDGNDATRAVSAIETAAQDRQRKSDRCADHEKALMGKLGRKREMLEELEEKRDRMRLYEKVANELRADRFIAFLLNESFHDLALRASGELNMISGGRYSLGADGDGFSVIDHGNADERRSVVTLSGGETFLASLALALALAQGIADIAGHSNAARLEAMFIDEGFGTLDPTALDLAVEALERLREGERMVGVVTHVPALAERIPSGVAVERQAGGSVVEMR